MKALHLFSNAKWTGPAEPALNLCVALRRLGIEADFACSPHATGSVHTMVETARDRGVEPILAFNLGKHRRPWSNFVDRRRVRARLYDVKYDIIHCHLDNDHRIAVGAAHGAWPIVRSNYDGDGLADTVDHKRLLEATHFLIEPSQRALDRDRATFDYDPAHMEVVPGAVDTERFDPRRDTPDGRKWLGIPPDAFVVGIVARMQTHRHYEDLLDALMQLIGENPKAHAIIVGRGTKQEEVARRPVRELGLEGRVHFPGYVAGDNYVGMLRAFDVKVFLVPGSDGTCRAVREAMAMGKPAVVADRGMLAEIVDDGVNGIVTDGSSEQLFAALARLANDRALVHAYGRAAREKALAQFSLDVQAGAVLNIYERLLREMDAAAKG